MVDQHARGCCCATEEHANRIVKPSINNMPEEKIRRTCHQRSTIDPVKWFKQDVQELDTLDHEQFYALVEKYEEQFMTEG